jgi:hypothetical protein
MAIQDPRLKANMKGWMSHILYGPYHTRRGNQLDNLIARNMRLQGVQYQCFTYRGDYFGVMYTGAFLRPKLHAELHHEMDVYLAEENERLANETPYVDNYIVRVLNASESFKDWLKLLPDSMKGPVYQLLQSFQSDPETLTPDQVDALLAEGAASIQKMKERMARNLLQS